MACGSPYPIIARSLKAPPDRSSVRPPPSSERNGGPSQSRRLDQADAAIRAAIALVLDVDEASFDVEVTPMLDRTTVSEETVELLELRRELSRLGERSRRLTPQAVAELRAAGLTVRDVAELLGVTPSRVSQIEHQPPMARSAS